MVSSANAIDHAFSAHDVLLPGETLDEYERTFKSWFDSLGPRNTAEARVVARLADLDFRQARIARAEETLVQRAIQARLIESAPYRALAQATTALEALRGLAALAETAPPEVPADRVAQILPGMNQVAEAVSALDLPVAAVAPLGRALQSFVLDTLIAPAPGAFAAVADASRTAEAALALRIAELQAAVDDERRRISEVTLCPTGEDARVLDRHRGRLAREMEHAAKSLKMVRELAASTPRDRSSLTVTLRSIGRSSKK